MAAHFMSRGGWLNSINILCGTWKSVSTRVNLLRYRWIEGGSASTRFRHANPTQRGLSFEFFRPECGWKHFVWRVDN